METPNSLNERARAELKRLAEAATPGPWKSVWSEPNPDPNSHDEVCVISLNPRPGAYGNFVFGLIWYDGPHAGGTKEDTAYMAAVSPDITLATLAYVKALETENATLAQQHQEAVARATELAGQLAAVGAAGWVSVEVSLPKIGLIHPRTGHKISEVVLVARQGVTHVSPHYLTESGSWFAWGASFATSDITHWFPYPTDPKPAAAPPLEREAAAPDILEAGRIDCPACGNELAWDNSWAGTGSQCKYCGYSGTSEQIEEQESRRAPLEGSSPASPIADLIGLDLQLLSLDKKYWQFIPGKQKPETKAGQLLIPDNPVEATGWSIYSGPIPKSWSGAGPASDTRKEGEGI